MDSYFQIVINIVCKKPIKFLNSIFFLEKPQKVIVQRYLEWIIMIKIKFINSCTVKPIKNYAKLILLTFGEAKETHIKKLKQVAITIQKTILRLL